jgi:hypothetical protein
MGLRGGVRARRRVPSIPLLLLGSSLVTLVIADPAAAEPARRATRVRPPAQNSAQSAPVDTTRPIDAEEVPALPPDFRELAQRSGEPQIAGLTIVYLHLLGDPSAANKWQHIIVHRTEGRAGSAA